MLKWKFGITLEDHDAMLEKQGGRCAICKSDDPAKKNGTLGGWCVDHDHASGNVRALLCNLCNTGLGSFLDDPGLMRAAALYVEAHKIP